MQTQYTRMQTKYTRMQTKYTRMQTQYHIQERKQRFKNASKILLSRVTVTWTVRSQMCLKFELLENYTKNFQNLNSTTLTRESALLQKDGVRIGGLPEIPFWSAKLLDHNVIRTANWCLGTRSTGA